MNTALPNPAWNLKAGFTRLLAGIVCLFLAHQSCATVLLDDTFADGDRTTQSVPSSAKWVVGGPSSIVSVSPTSGLTLTQTASAQATALAAFNKVTLQVGQSLDLSFSYSFNNTSVADNAFMFGLYNSGGQALPQDGTGFNSSVFKNYTGIATSGVFGIDPSGPGRDHIEERLPSAGNNLNSIGTYTEGQESIQHGAATPGEIYEASMQITRTASGLTVVSEIGTTQIVQQFAGDAITQFDTVGIFSNGNTGVFTFDNVDVEMVGVAPEPSTSAGIAALGMLVVGSTLRRRILAQGVVE